MPLKTEEQLERYSRHILLQEIGVEGQEKLLKSKVLIIGAGGLGSPAALYLAAAGVGTIGIADADIVELSNLQRQIIHFTEDLNLKKVASAKDKIKRISPDTEVETYHVFIKADNAQDIIKNYDFIIDGTDSFATKFLINDACIFEKKPFSHGGILRFRGQATTVIPYISACYRCMFDTPPPADSVPTCSQAGILGSVAGMLGTIQATEALKFITGCGDLLMDTLLTFDALSMDFRNITLSKNDNCRVCSDHPEITRVTDEEQVACDLSKGAGND